MIPVNDFRLEQPEITNVEECLRTGWISSSGKFIDQFEAEWADYCGRKYGVAVSNGTAALQLAVACLDLSPGDEVIVPTFTIISCATAILYNRGVPVLVDSDRRTWCMDISQLESRITERTRAIMPVHMYGHPVDMNPLLELADKYGLLIVEDAAEAHGAQYRSSANGSQEWRRCGSFGALSCFSFFANKLVNTGEGGMILTDDPRLAEKARSLRNLCFQSNRRFFHEDLGFNYRLTNLQAALGVPQVRRMDEIIRRKRHMGERYTERLKNCHSLQLPVEEEWARQVYWMYGIVVSPEAGFTAREFAARLKDRGIETRPFFLGIHEQPVLRREGLFEGESYPVAEHLARQGLYLPSGLALTDEQQDIVCGAVEELLS